MSFTLANTNHPELIDRFKCITRDNAIYPTSGVELPLPSPSYKLYIKMDIKVRDGSASDDKSKVILRTNRYSLLFCDLLKTDEIYAGIKIPLTLSEWHTFYFEINNTEVTIYIDGVYKGKTTMSTSVSDGVKSILFYSDVRYRNIIISDQKFSIGAMPIEIPIDSITGWDPSGENSYAADEDGQTCSIALNEAKINELKENYDISRMVCSGVIERQGDNLNTLGIMYGEEKKNISVNIGEHIFSADNPFGDGNIIHLIAKKV